MARIVTDFDPIAFRVAYQRAQTRTRRIVREGITLATLCLAAAVLATSLYLLAPMQLREAIVTTFLGFDQSGSTPVFHLVSP
jgi:hypothetical protein